MGWRALFANFFRDRTRSLFSVRGWECSVAPVDRELALLYCPAAGRKLAASGMQGLHDPPEILFAEMIVETGPMSIETI